ncbi:hypothetical protein AMJ39_05095 [candidate division TA06 bacterium DG_24]|uniref:Uncharacterized protein n=3 Tax=Bacteria division TA06 TaxID=1156500 RepID=A0A0S8JPF0_UNCT6|nr:MAG: hypothetical protein AMJ39_05095 [candidate division TA06 bacterium DG_24]KPK71500.1 MAG: hypothetical protein AMJ82_00630 [candidate division TA06 bacterium SM23_40]KPL11617.1 MAG: hypothetical protein AMJ71_00110 [candidate division TA06 bacterium SM1_40]
MGISHRTVVLSVFGGRGVLEGGSRAVEDGGSRTCREDDSSQPLMTTVSMMIFLLFTEADQ